MASSIQELMAQREALEKKIAEVKKQERSEAIAKIRQLMADFDLTDKDLGARAGRKPGGKTGRTVAPKYRDPATGQTWTGRGKPPKWIAGKDRNKFLIG